jgi:hypothetical protein
MHNSLLYIYISININYLCKTFTMKKILFFLFSMLASGGLFSQIVLLNEDMESYATSSFLGNDNPTWFTTWSNLPGSGEDAQILTNYAHSGTQSASDDLNGGQTDCIIKLGNKTTGVYELKWWMYIETNKCGYYNIQHFQTPGTEWAFEIYFRTNGTTDLFEGLSTIHGTYPKATWFEVKQIIKLDADSIYLYINGSLLSSWPFHYQSGFTTGTDQLGAVDLFCGEESGSGETPGFYFDDVTYSQLGTLAPTVVTIPATAVGSSTATLNGTVNANIQSTTVTFEYGLTTAYGSNVSGVPGTVTGNTVTPVLANLTGLLPGATYHYRVCGVNSIGTTNGLDMTFTLAPILPAVITTAANSITSASATLNGTVDAEGALTTVTFDYGTTSAYGTTVPGIPGTVTGNGATPASANITGLVVNTTYHYRINGVNSVGTTNGLDMTFFTTDCPMPSPAGVISGPINVCSHSLGNVYSIPPITDATGYTWTIPPGSAITDGDNTNSITLTLGTASGNVSVTGINTCGSGNTSTLAITVYPSPVPTITGQNSMCANSGYYNYSTQAGFTNYTWSVTAGGTITNGAGTNTIQVSWNTAGAQSVSVNYTNSSGCAAPTPTVLPVTVNGVPADAGTITGTPIVCSGTMGVLYSVETIDNALTYVWNIPQGATIASGSGTNTITIDWNSVSGPQTITVYGNNLCGSGASSPPYAVTVNPIPPAPVVTNMGYTVESDAPAGNQWYYNGALIAGAVGQTYDATLSGTGFYWSVVTLNNCSSDTSNHIYIVVTGIDSHSSSAISIYPVPSKGQFNVSITTGSSDSYSISVYNTLGSKIYEETKVEVNGSLQKVIDLTPMPNGVYTVIFENGLNQVVKKIIINK